MLLSLHSVFIHLANLCGALLSALGSSWSVTLAQGRAEKEIGVALTEEEAKLWLEGVAPGGDSGSMVD